MQYRKINEGYGYALVMVRGERIKEKLMEFAQTENVQNAYFMAVGAVENLRLGYYNLPEKKYFFREYAEMYEVASLQGNIVPYDDKPSVHMHAVLREADGHVTAGHLEDATVAITLEIFVHLLDGAGIKRKLDTETGLPLWNLDK